jgi:hypothetical protein
VNAFDQHVSGDEEPRRGAENGAIVAESELDGGRLKEAPPHPIDVGEFTAGFRRTFHRLNPLRLRNPT